MSNIVAVGGEPAVGKTTLMPKFFTTRIGISIAVAKAPLTATTAANNF